jgi:hypothetical protein
MLKFFFSSIFLILFDFFNLKLFTRYESNKMDLIDSKDSLTLSSTSSTISFSSVNEITSEDESDSFLSNTELDNSCSSETTVYSVYSELSVD